MSDTIFTTEQLTAISLRDKNLLVSASAGTGKTTVLVERIIRLATDKDKPVDIDRMLIVTFTNAASEEMKDRIRTAIYGEIKKNPVDERLRRQLILLNQASISTIHSFCSEVIRSNYHLLDIDPGFGVCDANDADDYLRQAVSETLAKAYEQGGADFEKLINGYGRGKDDSRFADLLIDFYKKLRSMPDYRSWLLKAAEAFSENYGDFSKTRWGSLIMGYSASRIVGYISDISDLMNVISDIETLSGYVESLALDKILLDKVYKSLMNDSWDDCSSLIQEAKLTKLNNAKRGAPDDLKQFVKDTRESYKKELEKIRIRLQGTSGQILDNMIELAPLMVKMVNLLNSLDDEYIKIKRDEGTLDYSDLEHYALKCLESEAGAMYRDRFEEIFVDEYQDSNQIQENIINLVSGRNKDENNVFMVGDIKQSIYKFRQAEPGIFKDKYDSFSEDVSKDNVKVELFMNYRSRKPVLDFTNYIFSRIMSVEAGDIDYDAKVHLKQGAGYEEGNDKGYPVELKLVHGEDNVLFTKDIKAEAREAAVIGREIFRIIESQMLITDKSTRVLRPVGFGDITILNRSANTVSAEYIRQLKKMGIPVHSESNSDFFKEREIIIMRSFLEILDNPRRDIPLLALLRSPMFGFTDKELAMIRCGSRREKFYDSLKNFNANSELKKKIDLFLEIISEYRKESHNRPMDRLVWAIMQDTGFYNQCLPDENPKARQQNLRRLFEIAGSYESSRGNGLFGFIKYLDNLSLTGTNDGSGGGSAGDAVKFMSIHKSKGLEFPVVILSGCGKSFNKTELTGNLIFDRDMGFGPDYINSDIGCRLVTAVKKGINIKKELEGLAEEMRVLYVALTRAREKLVITGYVKNIDKDIKKWQLRGRRKTDKIDTGKVMIASGFLDWLMPVVIKHEKSAGILEGMLMDDYKKDHGTPEFTLEIISPDEVLECMHLKRRSVSKSTNSIKLSYDEIKRRFEWEYPYAAESIYHKKISVTEIKKLKDVQNGEKDIFGTQFVPRPDFMSEKGKSDAAERGTLLHNIIAAIQPARALEPGYIEEFFINAGTPENKVEDYSRLIKGFFNSRLGKRMIASHKIQSEKPFLLKMPTKNLYPGAEVLVDDSHTTLVQGVIDCIFYENDGAVIVDYKSDNVLEGNEQAHAEKYKTQLDLYAAAVIELTGVPVKEKHIYFFKTGQSVTVM